MLTSSSFVFKDSAFHSNNWMEHLLVAGNEHTRMLVDHIPSGGHEGGSFRQHIQHWGKTDDAQPVTVCVAKHINKQALYRPSEKGAIISIDFDCSLMNIEHSTETHFAILLEQNNLTYVSKKTVSTKQEHWRTLSLNNLRSADFRKLTPTEPHRAQSEEDHPNFSLLGNEIRFGYATICSTSQPQDEAVSGIDFWRVTIYHEGAEAANRGMRVMQLEHNTGVLLQELADAHDHADAAHNELATQLAELDSLQKDAELERTAAQRLRLELVAQRSAAEVAEAEARSARAFADELQEALAEALSAPQGSDDFAAQCVAAQAETEQARTVAHALQRELVAERTKGTELEQYVRKHEKALQKKTLEVNELQDACECKNAKINRLQKEIEELKNMHDNVKRTIADTTTEVYRLHKEQEQTSIANKALQQTLNDTVESNNKLEELLKYEKKRRTEAEQTLASSTSTLQEELRILYARMEADISREQSLRLQMERSHREQINKIDEAARSEKIKIEEVARREKVTFLKKEEQLVEEKRNLATALQSAATKCALIDQNSKQLSSQLLSVSAKHRDEIQRAAVLASELKQEREIRELLESKLPKDEDDEEDWEVVDEL